MDEQNTRSPQVIFVTTPAIVEALDRAAVQDGVTSPGIPLTRDAEKGKA